MIISSSIILIFLGCFLLYNTSEKAILSSKYTLEKWVQTNKLWSKTIGLLLFIVALILSIVNFGLASGVIFWLLLLITALGLLVIIAPLRKITLKQSLVVVCIIVILDLIF